MRTLGKFTALFGVAVGVTAVVVGVQSITDVKRYLKMRAM